MRKFPFKNMINNVDIFTEFMYIKIHNYRKEMTFLKTYHMNKFRQIEQKL